MNTKNTLPHPLQFRSTSVNIGLFVWQHLKCIFGVKGEPFHSHRIIISFPLVLYSSPLESRHNNRQPLVVEEIGASLSTRLLTQKETSRS